MLLACRICEGQNLVPNGDFEQYSGCPYSYAEIDSALYWTQPRIPSLCSSDYFNQCNNAGGGFVGVPHNSFGDQQAHSGVAYCGIVLFTVDISNYREYVEVPLISALLANQCYHFEMQINLSENYGRYTTDDFGAYFSATLISGIANTNPLPFNPQINNLSGVFPDTANWTLMNGNFTATGGESYIIIGNFKNDANTDTAFVHLAMDGTCYVFIDDVSLTPCTNIKEQIANAEIKFYPNPVTEKLNIAINDNELSEIILHDILSRTLLQRKFTNSISINTEQLTKGIYLYEVRNRNEVIKKGKIVKE